MSCLGTLDEVRAAIDADEAELAEYRAEARQREADGRDPGHARVMVGVLEHRLGVLRERRRDKEHEARRRRASAARPGSAPPAP